MVSGGGELARLSCSNSVAFVNHTSLLPVALRQAILMHCIEVDDRIVH